MAKTENYDLFVVGAGEDPYVKDLIGQLCGEETSNMIIIDSELKNLADEVGLLKTSVSEGKALIASAVTGKGVQTADDATFAQIASNVSLIEYGIDTSDATASAEKILLNETAYVNGEKVTGTIPTRQSNSITVEEDRVYIQSGYYEDNIVKSVGIANRAAPTFDVVDQNNGSALIVATVDQEAGYVNAGTRSNTMYIAPSANYGIDNHGNLTITPYDAANNIDGNAETISIASLDSDVKAENIKADVNIFGVTGSYTSDADATINDILLDKTAYVNGQKIKGMVATKTFNDLNPSGNATLTIPTGYYAEDLELTTKVMVQENFGVTAAVYNENGKMLSSNFITRDDGFVDSTITDGTGAAETDIVSGKSAYVSGSKVTGTVVERGEADIITTDSSVTIPAGLYRSDVTKTISTGTESEWTYVYFSSDSSHPSDDIVSSVTHNFNDGSGMSRTFDITLTKDFLDAKLVYAAGISEDASCQTFFVCPSIEEYTGIDYEGMYYDDDDGGLFPISDVAYNNFYITKKIEVDIVVGSSNSVLLVDALYGYLAVKF